MGLFGRNIKPADGREVETVIGPATTLSGDLQVDGSVRIDGRFDGSLEAGGSVIVGEQGRVIADVRARHVTVGGSLQGNVSADGRLEILATGKVLGDVRVSQMVIDQGGVLQGMSLTGEMDLDRPALSAPQDEVIDAELLSDPAPEIMTMAATVTDDGADADEGAKRTASKSSGTLGAKKPAAKAGAPARKSNPKRSRRKPKAPPTVEAKARPAAQRKTGGLGSGLNLDDLDI